MNPLTPLVRRLGTRPALMRMAPAIIRLDSAVQRLTRGRVMLVRLAGLPALRLTVTGRKTGIARTTSLLSVPYGGGYIVTGSNWGRARHPVWTANLIADPVAAVDAGGRRERVEARQVTGNEKDALWRVIVDFWPGYEMEHAMAGGREFRMFVLEPMESMGPMP